MTDSKSIREQRLFNKNIEKTKDNILKAFNDYVHDTIEVPDEFLSDPDEYKRFTVRSAIIGELNRLKL